MISWDDQIIDAWLVVYRNDPGQGFRNSQSPRDKLWVADDGRVLMQQTNIFDSTLTVTRMTDDEAQSLARKNAESDAKLNTE